MKKKKKRQLTPIGRVLCYFVIIVSAFLLYSSGKELLTTFQLKQKTKDAEEKYKVISEENKKLRSQHDKLADPDYVQNYARSNYMLSKDGETILCLPSKEK